MSIAVGTLIASVILALVAAAMFFLPSTLAKRDERWKEYILVPAVYAMFPAGLAAFLFFVSIVFFVVA